MQTTQATTTPTPTHDAWSHAAELARKHASVSLYVRLANDGDAIVGAFCGEPKAREVVWTGDAYAPYDPDAGHSRPSLRVTLNFYDVKARQMKVIEGGQRWFSSVITVRDKYGLDRWLFEIVRHGAAGDPKTRYSILPERPIDEDLAIAIDKAPLHDLDQLIDNGADANTNASPPSAAGPIDETTADQLVATLRNHPRPVIDAFLARFGIARVRELPMRDLPHAKTFLAGLNGDADPLA